MRLPWPFGRSTSGAGDSTGPAGVDASAGSASTSGGPAFAAAADAPIPPTGAWRTLPPIQRSSGPPPVVAPAAPFLAEVPGHAPLPPIVTPLGHDSSPSAPAGMVVVHPHPVPSLTSHAPLPTRPVQRQAAPAGAPSMTSVSSAEAASPAAERPAAQSVGAGSAGEPAAAVPPAPDLPPIRILPPVAPAATVRPAARPLIQAAPALAPLASSGARGAASTAGPVRSSAPAGLSLPLQASGRIPPAAVAASSASPTAPAMPVRRFAELPAATPAPAVQRDASAGRRAGLGAPMTAAPASAVTERLPMRPGRPPALPERASASTQAVPVAAPADHQADHAPEPAAAVAAVARSLPSLPVARQRQDAAAGTVPATATTTTPRAAPRTVSTPAHAVPTVSRAASHTLPTVGARPLRPSVSTPGAQHRTGASSETASAADHDAPGPVAARWTADEALPATITSLPSTSASATGELPVQLSPAPTGPVATSSQAATSHDANTIVFPPRDGGPSGGGLPAWASSGPSGATASGTAAPAVAHAASRPATRQAQPPLTLARSVAAPAPAPAVAPSAPTPVVARIVADPSSPGAQPVVQTSPAGRGIPVATFTATPVVQREEAAAPAQAPAGNGHSDRELDELAKALFGRIRTQLKSEVIHEREAKGLGFDAF